MDPLLNVQNMVIVILYALRALHIGADWACYSANITWPKNGTGNITCDGEYACSYVTFPQPPPFEDMVLNCSEERECYGSIIKCPEYGNCHIICSASDACSRSIIKCPEYGNCHIMCSAYGACYSADWACYSANIT
eukprot:459808_1